MGGKMLMIEEITIFIAFCHGFYNLCPLIYILWFTLFKWALYIYILLSLLSGIALYSYIYSLIYKAMP